jgi:hypothetical protein
VARLGSLPEGARVLVRLALEFPEIAMGVPGPSCVCVAEVMGFAPWKEFSPLGLGLVILL